MNPFDLFEKELLMSVEAVVGVGESSLSCSRAQPPLPADEDVVIASIGYASEHARGNVTTLLTRSAAHALHPFELDVPSEAADCDVLGETANMILGRMKNQLLSRGVVLMVGTPTSTIARTVRVLSTPGPTSSAWYAFDHDRGRLYVRLDACFDPAFELGEASDVGQMSAGAEGESLFF